MNLKILFAVLVFEAVSVFGNDDLFNNEILDGKNERIKKNPEAHRHYEGKKFFV